MSSPTRLGYPYHYGDQKQTSYEIENGKRVNYTIQLVKKTTNLFKKMVTKTYKITEVISKNGINEKVKIIFVTTVFVLGLRFGSLNTSEIPTPLFMSSEVSQACVMKSDNSRILTSPPQISDLILKLNGGSDELTNKEQEEQEKLVKSILAKVPESDYQKISINKFLKKILKLVDPVISDQRFWRILSEFGKPIKSELPGLSEVRPTDIIGPVQNAPNKEVKPRSKGSSPIFAEALNIQNARKLSPMQKRVELNRAHKKDNFSTVNSLGRSECISPTLTPTTLETSRVPTADLFSADSVTGDIQNINIAFNKFKQRMTQIGNQYTGKKQEYFFEQLNQCEIQQFQALSTENGSIKIGNVREAETLLQSEFEGYHEPNSITRPTKAERQEGNVLDGRFRKGMLNNEPNTLNEQYTDVDVKLLVSDETLEHQANERRILSNKNPNKMSMYEQGKGIGISIVVQKHKHCNPNKPELPSSPDNVKHIINALELIPSETEIAKAGVLDGARIAWADKLNVPESSISDQTALQGTIFLNEEYTIERVN